MFLLSFLGFLPGCCVQKGKKTIKYRTGIVAQGRGAISDQPELEPALEILQEEMYGAGSTAARAHGLAKSGRP
jgi:hypothetical protein